MSLLVDLDAFFAENPLSDGEGTLSAPPGFRSGFIALCGRPNAGKSTLMNALVGQKVAVTSATPQTTRNRIRGILTLPASQMVFVDTPGLHKPHDLLGEQLNAQAASALDDVDIVAMVVDSTKPVGAGDEWVAASVAASPAAKMLVLSKSDIASSDQTAQQFERARDLAPWDAVVSLSAVSGYNTGAFLDEVLQLLPEGPLWFPEDAVSDVALETMIAEVVREKVLRHFREEVPHSVGVKVDELEDGRSLLRAEASIFVERDSQKAMLIGAKGAQVKQIGTRSRADLEQMFHKRVYLGLKVKVKKNWRKDEHEIRRLGYME